MHIFLHIGLHKTGTTFLQKNFQKNLSNKKNIDFNPPEIMPLLELIFVNRKDIKSKILKIKKIIESKKRNRNVKNLFISSERISQLFCTNNYEENLLIIKDIFPKAKIILFLRYQTDWLLSCYKQSIHSGDCQSIENFLNYKNNKFKNVNTTYNSKGFLHTSIHKVDYFLLVEKYIKQYGKKNVFIFFYENFKKNKKKTVSEICKILKINNINYITNDKVNRSFSSLACELSIHRYNFLKIFSLHKYLPTSKKLRNKLITKHQFSNISWEQDRHHLFFLTLVHFFLYKVFIKFLTFFTWRNFIHNYFDKVIYINRDLLGDKIRNKLNLIFRKKNKKLLKYVSKNKIPSKYLR